MIEARIEEIRSPCFMLAGLQGSEEDIRVLESTLAEAGFGPGTDWLIDNRELRRLPTKQDVMRIVAFARRHCDEIGRCRVALVVSSAAAYGMGRMLEALADCSPLEVRTFRGMSGARRWLEGACE